MTKITGDSVVEIAIRTGDSEYSGTDVPVKIKICDGAANCCQTSDNLHYKFGDDRKRGSVDVYADVDLLGNCDEVRFYNFWFLLPIY